MNPALLAPARLCADEAFTVAVGRLTGITGFASTVCADDDRRPSVFSRLHHIVRVAQTWELVASEFGLDVDPEVVCEAIWLHDLNRWPFAHNLERERYNQAADARRYLTQRSFLPAERVLRAIDDLHAWNWKTDDASCLVAVAADRVAGIVEDLLVAICGLNLAPAYLGDSVLELVGVDAEDRRTADHLAALHRLLNRDGDVAGFTRSLGEEHRERVTLLLRRGRTLYGTGMGGLSATIENVHSIRNGVIGPRLFPINNDGVSRRPALEQLAFQPAFAAGELTLEPEDMLQHDDTTMARLCVSLAEARESPINPGIFVPDLDFVPREMSEWAFVL